MYPTDLTDTQWQIIKKILGPKIAGRKRKHGARTIINAILYLTMGGAQWRGMPGNSSRLCQRLAGDAWQQLKALPALGGGCLATAESFASA
jgi:hypothetical protein